MTTTLLQLVGQVANELALPQPSSVVGNTNQDVVQILALMNACGYELVTEHPWRALTMSYLFTTQYLTTTGTWTTSARTITGIPTTSGLDATYQAIGTGINQGALITTVDSAVQVTMNQDFTSAGTGAAVTFQKIKYSLPSDYDSLIPRTMWDKSKHWEMLGPEDAQQWEWLMSGYIATGPRIRWRLLGDYFQIWPGFSNAELLGFEYRSKGWARDSGGTVKNSFTVDTDTCIYPDRLMVNMTKLKYFEGKGFDTTAMARNYMLQLESAIANDTSSANLSLAPQPGNVLIDQSNIPDSGFGH